MSGTWDKERVFYSILSWGVKLMAFVTIWVACSTTTYQVVPFIFIGASFLLFITGILLSPLNVFVRRANRRLRKGDYAGALHYATRALEIKSNWVVALAIRGQAYMELHDYLGALADLDKAIELKSKYLPAYMIRAFTYVRMDDPKNALVDANRVIALKPKSPFALNTRGVMLLDDDQLEVALLDFNEAIRRKPKLAEAYCNRGIAHGRMGNFEVARLDFDRAIQLNPRLAETYSNRGEYFLELQDYPAALADYQKANDLKPALHGPLAGLALTYFLMGNIGPAKNFWRLLVERDTRFQDAEWAMRKLHLSPTLTDAVHQFFNHSS